MAGGGDRCVVTENAKVQEVNFTNIEVMTEDTKVQELNFTKCVTRKRKRRASHDK
jgi:hypothetical protein